MRYEAMCLECAEAFDYYSSVAARAILPPCPCCSSTEVRRVILTAPVGVVTGKFEAFKSNIDGSLISNQRDLEEHNRRNNVRLLGEGYSNEDILAGKCVEKAPEVDVKKDVAKDIVDSIRRVEAGYKPIIANEGAEL